MAINYNDASKTYDNTRKANISIIEMFAQRVKIDRNTTILDVGCGTGNYFS